MKVDLEQIIEEYSNMILQIAYQNCCNKSDSEDITQEVFIKLMKNIDKIGNKEHMNNIKASDELKSKIKANILDKEESKKIIRGGIIMKIKRIATSIIATATALVCGGVAFATLKSSAPTDKESGIKFSENYAQYEKVEENGPIITKDGATIQLKSTVVDEGFIVLKFNVKLNEEQTKAAEDKEGGLYYLSFNDKVTNKNGVEELALNGANYNLLIDGKENWIRPGAYQTKEEIVFNKEYNVYQMWFLANELDGKDNFKITLNDVVMCANDKLLKFDDKFDIELSKSKINADTEVIDGQGTKIEYKKMQQVIENIKATPLQNIVEISSIQKNVKESNLTYLNDKDYVGDISYKVYDQDGKELTNCNFERMRKITYEDGASETLAPGDYDFSKHDFKNAKFKTKEYIAIEQNENISSIRIEVYASIPNNLENYEIRTNIGEYKINLKTKEVTSKNKNHSEKVKLEF